MHEHQILMNIPINTDTFDVLNEYIIGVLINNINIGIKSIVRVTLVVLHLRNSHQLYEVIVVIFYCYNIRRRNYSLIHKSSGGLCYP